MESNYEIRSNSILFSLSAELDVSYNIKFQKIRDNIYAQIETIDRDFNVIEEYIRLDQFVHFLTRRESNDLIEYQEIGEFIQLSDRDDFITLRIHKVVFDRLAEMIDLITHAAKHGADTDPRLSILFI